MFHAEILIPFSSFPKLLLKTNMGAGHFGASSRYERYRETALDYAFLWKALGRSGRMTAESALRASALIQLE